jgi:hypothetical protein
MLWCNTGRLTTSSQLCAEALDSFGQGEKAAGAPSEKIPASSPMDIPGSPLSPSVLKPVAAVTAIAMLFNSREQRIQQQKERRERRKEMTKLGKSTQLASAPRLYTSPLHLASKSHLYTSPLHLASTPRLCKPLHLASTPRLYTSPQHLTSTPRL